MKIFRRNQEKKLRRQAQFNELKQQLSEEFQPVINTTDKKVISPVKNWMQKNPVFTFAVMIAIIILNVVFINVFKSEEPEENNSSYNELISKSINSSVNQNQSSLSGASAANIFTAPGTIINSMKQIERIEQIKDSLSLLLLKKNLTKEDSFAFIKLSEEAQAIQNSLPQ